MPRTSNPPITRQHALHERRPVMRALAPQRRDLAADIAQEDLAFFDTLDFDLAFLAGLEVEAAEVLELVFSSHGA